MAQIKYIISTFFALVMLLTSVAQYHHHDCAGNIFLCLTGDDNELAIGYSSHGPAHCNHTDHDAHCPATHHHHGSTAECSLHLNDVVETKSVHSPANTLDSSACADHISQAILSSYPLLYQTFTYVVEIQPTIDDNDILDIITTDDVTRRGPPYIV